MGAAPRGELRGGADGCGAVDVPEGDARAARGEPCGDGQADARGTAGDDGTAAG